jgi:hypothetical protein
VSRFPTLRGLVRLVLLTLIVIDDRVFAHVVGGMFEPLWNPRALGTSERIARRRLVLFWDEAWARTVAWWESDGPNVRAWLGRTARSA